MMCELTRPTVNLSEFYLITTKVFLFNSFAI